MDTARKTFSSHEYELQCNIFIFLTWHACNLDTAWQYKLLDIVNISLHVNYELH